MPRSVVEAELHRINYIPWDFVSRLTPEQQVSLHERLKNREGIEHGMYVRNVMSATWSHRFSHSLIINCQHGLGSRIRTLASAMALAEETHRLLLVVWSLDSHCSAPFESLFSAQVAG